MRITKITVTNLFGIYNHDVPLNMDDRITLIHGPNGIGKTILLSMINAFFKSQYSLILKIPFDKLKIYFDNKRYIEISKLNIKGKNIKKNKKGISMSYKDMKNNKIEEHTSKFIDFYDIPSSLIEDTLDDVERIGIDDWVYTPTNEHLSKHEVIERFEDEISVSFSERFLRRNFALRKSQDEPNWLKEIKKSVNIIFIKAERLLIQKKYYRGKRDMIPAVKLHSKKIAECIQEKLNEYASLSQSLDRQFPLKLVKGKIGSKLSIKQLKKKVANLENKRLQLITAGLLEKETKLDSKELSKIDENKRDVLSVYVNDVEEKLGVFDEITKKIELFVNIINNKFLNKKLSIDKKNGFIFHTKENEPLELSNLSSGEQHELVLFFELLFNIKENTLVLMDEPEISLHILWQQKFLEDLQKITKLSNFDILIATHSPQIIHNNWNLAINLEEDK